LLQHQTKNRLAFGPFDFRFDREIKGLIHIRRAFYERSRESLMAKKICSSSSWLLTVPFLVIATACGGGGGGGGGGAVFTPPNSTISGQATAGVVNAGTVEVYGINTSNRALTLLGSGPTNSLGLFTVGIQGSGPFLVLLRGGTFTDEATNTTANIGNPAQPTSLDSSRANTLEAVVGSGVNGAITVNLSPLTTFASRRLAELLKADPDAYSTTNVTAINQLLGQEMGLGSIDTTGILPIDFTNGGNATFIAGNLADSGVLLGAILSALSQAAVDLGVAIPMDLIEALAQDFSDGIFNGAIATAQAGTGTGISLGTGALPQNAGTTQLSTSLSNFLNGNANNNSGTNSTANNAIVSALNTLDVTPGGNTAPFFGGIADQTVLINAAPSNLTIMGVSPGAPASESAQTVTVIATSSDPAILPNPAITGAGATRTLTLSPGATGGVVTVTVNAQDDGGTANGGFNIFTRSFQVTVFAPNQAPTFDTITNQTVNEDSGATAIMITNISAVEASQTITSVTASSSNTALIPNPPVVGSGASRTLTFTPAADAFGTTTITVTVQDDGGTANGGVNTLSRMFTVTVNSINDAPTFDAIANQNVAQNVPSQMVTITGVTGGPTNESQTVNFSASSSSISIVPDPIITGTGATRTLTYTPVAAASGTVTITVTGTDPDGMALGGVDNLVRTFDITVVAPAGNAVINSVVPALASSAGGTTVQVATSMFIEDFTVTAPTATVAGMGATVTVVNSTTVGVTVPAALTPGTQTIEIITPTDTASFTSFEIVSPVAAGDVIINEVLYDPSGSDSNNDNVATSNEDEFIEFVNTRTTGVDLTGFQITEGNGTIHVFPNPTTVPGSGALVLFGGGTPTGFPAAHANGSAQIASNPNQGGLGLNNAGDTVTLLDPAGAGTINAVTFGTSTSQAESINRMTDADPAAAFVLHSTVTGAITQPNLGNYTPGTKVDGTPHGPGGPTPTIDSVIPNLADVAGGTRITLTASNFGDFTVAAPTVSVGGTVVPAMSVMANSFTFDIPTGLAVSTVTVNVTNSNGNVNFTTFRIVASVVPGNIVINEFLAELSNSTSDSNGDGAMSNTDDEFVELVNILTTPVDISGFQIADGAMLRHSFTNPTTIPAGGSIVVFGGGTPTGFPAAHANGAAQIASTSSLALNNVSNGGDTISFNDPANPGTPISTRTYTLGTEGVSRNLMTDGLFPSGFVDHTAVVTAVGNFSPGTKVDGTTLHTGAGTPPPPPTPSIDTVVPSAGQVAGGTLVRVTTSGFGDLTQGTLIVTFGPSTLSVPTGLTPTGFTIDVPPAQVVGPVSILMLHDNNAAQFTTFQIVPNAVPNDLFINEFFADPSGPSGTFDANGDGMPDAADDEFVEIINTLSTPIDITNFTITDASTTPLRHTFPNPTVIPANGAIVVFGGGTATGFPAAQTSGAAQTASTGGLILTNGGDTITIADAGATTITAVTYTSVPNGNSSNRATDGSPMGLFVDHTTVAGSTAAASPGTKVAGGTFP
jgi:hypothetical protein